MDSSWNSMVQSSRTANDDCGMDKDWPDAAKFRYLLQILEVTFKDYIPKWQIFVEQDDDFPTMILKCRYPCTVWDGHPVLGFMKETDFKDDQGNYLKEASFADFNPMWSYPPTAVKSNYDNITFGMDALHLRSDPPHSKAALTAQGPIVVFKAATVLQSLGIIASRVLLPSSDVQGDKRDRASCPTTWNYAYEYDIPAKYSDLLREQGAPALLAHECVLSVIAQM